MLNLDEALTLLIILLGIILVASIFLTPKDDCDTCSFEGVKAKNWFQGYSKRCLQEYGINQKNPNIPTLNLSNLSTQS